MKLLAWIATAMAVSARDGPLLHQMGFDDHFDPEASEFDFLAEHTFSTTFTTTAETNPNGTLTLTASLHLDVCVDRNWQVNNTNKMLGDSIYVDLHKLFVQSLEAGFPHAPQHPWFIQHMYNSIQGNLTITSPSNPTRDEERICPSKDNRVSRVGVDFTILVPKDPPADFVDLPSDLQDLPPRYVGCSKIFGDALVNRYSCSFIDVQSISVAQHKSPTTSIAKTSTLWFSVFASIAVLGSFLALVVVITRDKETLLLGAMQEKPADAAEEVIVQAHSPSLM